MGIGLKDSGNGLGRKPGTHATSLVAEAHSAQRHIKTNELIGGPNTSFDGAIRDFVGGSAGGAY
jgi:hypothetical protein